MKFFNQVMTLFHLWTLPGCFGALWAHYAIHVGPFY